MSRGDVNQLLGQIEVETKRAAKTRVYGCLLTPATSVQNDAAEAARDKITLINHDGAVRLYNLLADRLLQYAALCGDGNAEARGDARTKIEAMLPKDGWLVSCSLRRWERSSRSRTWRAGSRRDDRAHRLPHPAFDLVSR